MSQSLPPQGPTKPPAAAPTSPDPDAPRSSIDAGVPELAADDAPSASGEGPLRIVLDHTGVTRAATRIAHEIVERNKDLDKLVLVAIAQGGTPVGRLIADQIEEIRKVRLPLGELDVTLYRDDVIGRGKRPVPHRTSMPQSVAGRRVILIDDVMFTGRTIRAAMDAVIDFGRPEGIQVACLVDRGHRELPIQVDFVGKNIPTQRSEQVVLVEDDAGQLEVRVE